MSRRKVMAKRSPCGRASRAGAIELLPPTEMRRLFDAAITGLRDPLFGTMLGRIHLAGKISRAEFAAGKRWAELTTEYAVSCQAPRPPQTVCSRSRRWHASRSRQRRGRRRSSATPAPALPMPMEVCAASGRQAAELAVEQICINEFAPAGFEQLKALQRGLRALSEFWTSSTKRKAGAR